MDIGQVQRLIGNWLQVTTSLEAIKAAAQEASVSIILFIFKTDSFFNIDIFTKKQSAAAKSASTPDAPPKPGPRSPATSYNISPKLIKARAGHQAKLCQRCPRAPYSSTQYYKAIIIITTPRWFIIFLVLKSSRSIIILRFLEFQLNFRIFLSNLLNI